MDRPVRDLTGPLPHQVDQYMSRNYMEPSSLTVVLAVLTYKRPDDLNAILPRLVDQLSAANVPGSVLVVDNDPEAAARGQVAPFADQGVRYVSEPRPGIAAARNRALAEASGADLLVFIDDDERPHDDWLTRLVATYRDSRPVGVVGPVISQYVNPPDAWVSAGRFFERRRLPTGTHVGVAATNNLLLDMHQLRALGIAFDEEFGLTGGSDTLFSREIVQRGGRLVWCDEAVVVDVVPPHRCTRSWVIRRAFRSGNGWSRTSLRLSRTPVHRVFTRSVLTGRGGIRLLGGAVRVAAGVATGSLTLRARGTRTFARGAGMVSGAFGHVYTEYKRT